MPPRTSAPFAWPEAAGPSKRHVSSNRRLDLRPLLRHHSIAGHRRRNHLGLLQRRRGSLAAQLSLAPLVFLGRADPLRSEPAQPDPGVAWSLRRNPKTRAADLRLFSCASCAVLYKDTSPIIASSATHKDLFTYLKKAYHDEGLCYPLVAFLGDIRPPFLRHRILPLLGVHHRGLASRRSCHSSPKPPSRTGAWHGSCPSSPPPPRHGALHRACPSSPKLPSSRIGVSSGRVHHHRGLHRFA